MTFVLDAGALVAIERGDARIHALLKQALIAGRPPATHGGVVGQVWRGGRRQAALARALAGILVVPLDDELGRRGGTLLAATRTSDIVDAALVLLARDGDTILTSDPKDIARLAAAAQLHVDVVRV